LPQISWKTKWFSVKVPSISKPAPCVAPTPCPSAPTPCQKTTPCEEVAQGSKQSEEIHDIHGASIIGTVDEEEPEKPTVV